MTMETLTPSLDTWTSIFALSAAQGFFLTILLYSNQKGNRKANFFLATLLLFFSVTLSEYVLHWTHYIIKWPYVALWYIPLAFTFGPLLLLYFVFLESNKKWKWKYSFHFLPALLMAINLLPFYCSPVVPKAALLAGDQAAIDAIWWSWLDLRGVRDYMIVIHQLIYASLIVRFIKKVVLEDDSSEYAFIRKRWAMSLWYLYVGFVIANTSYYLLIRTPYYSIEWDYGISLTMSVFIYITGYIGLRQPEIFSGNLWPAAFLAPKYQTSSLTPSASQSLVDKLIDFVESEKPYLDNELRLGSLADQLGVAPHHLSQVINEQLGKSFSDFINQYRIKEAQQLLFAPEYIGRYIIDIAYASGFNNKTSFYKAFKEATGMSPSDYKRKNNPNKTPSPSSNAKIT